MTDLEALRAENKTLLERTQATMRAHAEVVKARNEASEAVEVREAEIASYGVAWLAMGPPISCYYCFRNSQFLCISLPPGR